MRRQRHQGRKRLLGVELLGGLEQDLFRFRDVRIGDAAVDRTDGRAGFLVVETDALGAEQRIDDEDVLALRDGLVGALRLAGAAVDALFGDHRRHRVSLITRSGQPIHTALVLVNSRIPSTDNSRPWPEALMPPKGRRGSLLTMPLMKTMPACNSSARRACSLGAVVKGAAPSPKGGSFATAMALSSSRAEATRATSPTTSSPPRAS